MAWPYKAVVMRQAGLMRQSHGISKQGYQVELWAHKDRYGMDYVVTHSASNSKRGTPFLDRAKELYDLFMRDITNPSVLGNPNVGRAARSWKNKEKFA